MLGELITLPVRVGVRATRLWFRAVEEAISVTAAATGRAMELVTRRSDSGRSPQAQEASQPPHDVDVAQRDETPEAARPAQPGARPRPAAPAARAAVAPPPPPPRPPEPVHVSEEPTLVEEFAEPGAEDGVGAQVRVEPPWDGYERMTAKQVMSRLASASSAELAAVQLYELSHRGRQTIVNAVERELRKANGRGSRGQQRG
jgi:hypothetical protein